jgi:hypothetical protein
MRDLQLRDCDTVVLNLPGETARRESTSALCERLGLRYSVMDAIACAPGPIGCGLSHIKALRAWTGERPLLILEDDVAATDDIQPTITVPDDADAIYLGVSRYGAVEPVDYVGFVDVLAVERVADGLLRFHNVLGAHAILHLTDRWRLAAIEAMTEAIVDLARDPDRGLAKIQCDFNVYAPERPAFYQAAALQPEGKAWQQEEATKAILSPVEIGTVMPIWLGGDRKELRLVRDQGRLRWTWA